MNVSFSSPYCKSLPFSSNASKCEIAFTKTKIQKNNNRKVNLRGVFLGCKFACAQFLKQELDSSGHRGWIVNTASMLGLVGIAGGAGELVLSLFLPSFPYFLSSFVSPPPVSPSARGRNLEPGSEFDDEFFFRRERKGR